MTTEPGRTLSHYRLIEKIGEGGMGVVWKAEDTVLGRTVAIKVLPADHARDEKRRKMFFDEARLASSLSEAHIVQVHEFGHEGDLDFIVMEYVEGKPLNKVLHGRPMPPEKVAEIGYQVAHAISKAHRKGLIHRDLKPANILITPDGDAKVVDFGLATLFTPQETTIGTEGPTQTFTEGSDKQQRSVTGTIPYMSPEQVRGEKLDARSDIFSLGTVLYEMTTGQRPFRGTTNREVASEILKSRPKPVHEAVSKVPLDLDKIIAKSLSPRRGDRYQNSEDLAVDLKRLGKDLESGSSPSYEELGRPIKGTRPRKLLGVSMIGVILLVAGYFARHLFVPTDIPSDRKILLAVLPFENLSGDPDQEYFSDGMTEEMIAQLGMLNPKLLGVIARTSVIQFKDTHKDIHEIGQDLGVDYILEGSVLQASGKVRITSQLIQVSDQTNLWAESYQRDAEDIFAIQSEVAHRVASSLAIELLPRKAESLDASTTSLHAHEAYLKGRFFWNMRTEEGVKKGLEYFQEGIQRDPEYALAYAGLADSYLILGAYDWLKPDEAYPKAKEAAKKALELDSTLAQAHVTIASIKSDYEWDWSGAGQAFRRAIEMNPNYATAHQWYSLHLSILGRHDEAIEEAKRAQELDPLSLIITQAVGWRFYVSRQYDQAMEQFRSSLEMYPNNAGVHYTLCVTYEQKSLYEEAIAACQESGRFSEGRVNGGLGRVYALSGEKDKARNILDQLKKKPEENGGDIALIYSALGEDDQALEWIEKLYEKRSRFMTFLKVEPQLDSLRSNPRFQDLLQRMNFPE